MDDRIWQLSHRGMAVGLLWASSIVRSSWLLVIAVPQRVVYAQAHFMAVWRPDTEVIRIVDVVCGKGIGYRFGTRDNTHFGTRV